MRFTWTREALNHATAYEMLMSLVAERRSTVTNIYSPLSRRLQHLEKWLENNGEKFDYIPQEFKLV